MLAYIVAGLVVLSLICIFAALISGALGNSKALANGEGIWLVVETIPGYALPLAFILLIAFFIVVAVRKSRANRAGAVSGTSGLTNGVVPEPTNTKTSARPNREVGK